MTQPARPGLRDRVRTSWYLTRLSWALQDLPRRERTRVLTELRADTYAAAADVGTERALADLGHPRVLADRYLAEVDRPLPRMTTGAVAAALAIGALLHLATAYAFGTLDTLLALGGGTRTAHPLGAQVVFTATDDTIAVEGTLSWQGLALHAGVGLVAFVLGSRLWRALPSRDRRPVEVA
ncbi:MAG TPA: hypothetical protein VKZ83_12995 [Phototrophicaceae bacterium]|nr:hypothetical protein [Phototrophicaceae bacterium]